MTVIEVLTVRFPQMIRGFRLNDVPLEAIRAEEIALERREQELTAAQKRAEDEIAAITREAVDGGARSAARRATRRILLVRDRMRLGDAELADVSQQLCALSRLRSVRESANGPVSSGVLRQVLHAPMGTLSAAASRAQADLEVRREGLDQLNSALAPAPERYGEEDADARELRLALESAIEGRDQSLASGAIERATRTPAEHESRGL